MDIVALVRQQSLYTGRGFYCTSRGQIIVGPKCSVQPLVAASYVFQSCHPTPRTRARHLRSSPCTQEDSCSTSSITGQANWVQAAASGLITAALICTLSALPCGAASEFSYRGEELFSPMGYAGRWFEVASLKLGFAGEGQQDCHCTQGVYSPVQDKSGDIKLSVTTFCVHGAPEGRISGIRGAVSCANPVALKVLPEFETTLEREEGIVEKCVLRFPSIPFIPPQPYDVIRTDYKSFALVQGAPDRTFVQIYSRVPNPGPEFIAKQKAILADLGYPVALVRDTPQDCPVVPVDTLMGMMGGDGPANNTMPAGITLTGGIQLAEPSNPLQTIKDLFSFLKAEQQAANQP